MSKEHVEISSDDEGIKGQDEADDKRLVYNHKHGTVELHSKSLECLKSGSYLKDDIVQFYLTYLVNEECSQSIASRIHVFDSIFYNQLEAIFTDEKIDRFRLRQIRKWYNDIDVFKKDFLVFPICYEDHWIVVVACYPAAVKLFDTCDEDDGDIPMDDSDDLIPGLVIMDSLDLRDPKKTKISLLIREFLDYNWRSCERPLKRFSHYDLADYFPKLPKQTNHFDCGLYMLMYVKCFIEKPDHFYNSIRNQGESTGNLDALSTQIKAALEDNNRDKIKALINRVCS